MRYQEIEQLTSLIKSPLSSIRCVYLLQVLCDVIFRIQICADTGCGSYCGRDIYERWNGQSVCKCYKDDEAYGVPSLVPLLLLADFVKWKGESVKVK
jgi:hypothetical protein